MAKSSKLMTVNNDTRENFMFLGLAELKYIYTVNERGK
jgi:hypothetical protein